MKNLPLQRRQKQALISVTMTIGPKNSAFCN